MFELSKWLKNFQLDKSCHLMSFIQAWLTVQTAVNCTLRYSSNCSKLCLTLQFKLHLLYSTSLYMYKYGLSLWIGYFGLWSLNVFKYSVSFKKMNMIFSANLDLTQVLTFLIIPGIKIYIPVALINFSLCWLFYIYNIDH